MLQRHVLETNCGGGGDKRLESSSPGGPFREIRVLVLARGKQGRRERVFPTFLLESMARRGEEGGREGGSEEGREG